MKNYILLITIHADPAMPPGYGECGGTQTYMRELLDAFGKLNIPCILVTRKSMHYLPSEEQYNPTCKIIRLINGNDEPMSKLLLYQYHKENLEKISKIIDSQETYPSIIHSVYWNSGRLAMELSRKYGIPFVHSVISNSRGRVSRGAYEPLSQRAEYEQEIYNHAKKILCVSEDEKNDLIKFYHIAENKLVVCGQYVDSSFIDPAHDENGYPHINSRISSEVQRKIALKYNNIFDYDSFENFWQYKAFTYFGRIDLNKGILEIIEAWYGCYKIYGQYCPPLWIVGGSIADIVSLRKKIAEIITEINILEKNYKLVWWGYLNTQGLSTVLLKTQVVLMHSLYEPGGRVVVEAMSEGLPVIGTFNGFAKDFIHDWENGFLVNHGDIKALTERMEHFIRQPFLSDVLGRHARSDAEKIIKRWAFLDNHLQAYGIPYDLSESEHGTEQSKNNIEDTVCVFPYAEHELATDYIAKMFATFSSQEVISVQSAKSKSNHKLLQTAQEDYYMKQITPRLMYDPLYNPFSKDLFVTDPRKLFCVETTMQLRLQSPMFVGSDSLHRLLFYHNAEALTTDDGDYIKKCLDTMLNFPDVISMQEKNVFQDLINNTDVSSQTEIEDLFGQLDKKLPRFYFPRSGIFSLKISWAVSNYILQYNKHILDLKLYYNLSKCCDFFNSKEYILDSTQIRNILPAIMPQNFRIFRNKCILEGLHETCLGTITTQIGIFLYNYCRQMGISILAYSQNSTIISELKNRKINMEEFWTTIAYCLFLDIIIMTVVNHKSCEKELSELESITQLIL